MQSRFALAALLGVATAMTSGCRSTPEKRIAANEAGFAAMSPEAQAAIRAGKVELGFTPAQVQLARGKPDRVVRRTTAKGEEMGWIYEKRGPRFGFSVGGGSGGLGGGVGMSTGGRGAEVDMVVNFSAGVVSSVETGVR